MTVSSASVAKGLDDRVRALVEEVIQGTPYYVVEVSIRGHKGSRVVDIYLDADEGVDVDALAKISREVGFLLDTEEVIAGKYQLNVSSPGVDRPLQLPRQFRKNVGRELYVRYHADAAEQKVKGKLVGADEEAIELAMPQGEVLRLPYDALVEAKVQLPW